RVSSRSRRSLERPSPRAPSRVATGSAWTAPPGWWTSCAPPPLTRPAPTPCQSTDSRAQAERAADRGILRRAGAPEGRVSGERAARAFPGGPQLPELQARAGSDHARRELGQARHPLERRRRRERDDVNGIEGRLPQEARRGDRESRQGGAAGRRGEVLRGPAGVEGVRPAGADRRRRRPCDRRQLRARPHRDDPVRAPVPDPPLAAELLLAERAPGPRLADA